MSSVMMKVRALAPFFVLSGIAFGIGCSSKGDQEDPAITAARNQASQQASDDGDWVAARFEYCELQLAQTGVCSITDPGLKTTFVVVDPTIKDFPNPLDALNKARQVVSDLRKALSAMKQNICGVLGPLAGLDHPYFYYGAYGQGAFGPGVQGGVDFVWDLNDLQMASFGYSGVGLALPTLEAGAYAGYGFGNKNNVVDAWSGRFCSASAGVTTPIKLVGAGGTVFASPDGTVYGGAATVSVGISIPKIPLSASVFASDWTEWDAMTEGVAQNKPWFIGSHIVKTGNDPSLPPEQRNKEYVQYDSSKDMALAILWNMPNALGIQAATQVLALAAMKKTGLTIDQMCPKEAQAARDNNQSPLPQPAQMAAKLCGDVPNPLNPNGSSSSSSSSSGGSSSGDPGAMDGGTDSGLSKTDCADKSDGWWCLDAPGWMAYCEGKQIKSGCGCSGCTAQGQAAPCTSDIYVCTSH